MWETWVCSLGWEDPLEMGMATLQYSCLDNPHGRGAWWATVHGVAKNQTRLSDKAQRSENYFQGSMSKLAIQKCAKMLKFLLK